MLADRVRMGSAKETKLILYDYGVGSELFEVGLSETDASNGTHTTEKRVDHLYNYIDWPSAVRGGSSTFVTKNKINLSNTNTINIFCDYYHMSSPDSMNVLFILNSKTSKLPIKSASAIRFLNGQTVTLDVSELVGEYYIAVGIIDTNSNSSELKTYSIWLEK